MSQAINLIIAALLAIVHVVLAFIAFADGALSAAMTSAGVPPNAQAVLLVVVAILLALLAIRLLGGLLAGLILILLMLVVVERFLPGLDIPQGSVPAWLTPGGVHGPLKASP